MEQDLTDDEIDFHVCEMLDRIVPKDYETLKKYSHKVTDEEWEEFERLAKELEQYL